MKSILNKLTVEKFPQLYQQLIDCGARTAAHVEQMIKEVFEKATSQHHFINMYADLCALLHEHFAQHPVSDDAGFSFKRVLLAECQASFERHLTPPEWIQDIADFDERSSAEQRYKTNMLGNIRFVGALLTRGMLATKVMFAICRELVTDSTPETLESVAALLTVVGPTFDRKEFLGRPMLSAVFEEIEAIAKQPSCHRRASCLLRDVLDLRAGGWRDRRPARAECPTTLCEVAERAARAEAVEARPTLLARSRGGPSGAASKKAAAPAPRPRPSPAPQARPFDRDEFRRLLGELRASFDEAGAAERLARLPPPPLAEQAGDLCFLLSEVAQERAPEVRKAGFSLAAKLFFGGLTSTCECWTPRALVGGLREFADDVCDDLRVDVPALPDIVRNELAPTLRPLRAGGLLTEDSLQRLLVAVA